VPRARLETQVRICKAIDDAMRRPPQVTQQTLARRLTARTHTPWSQPQVSRLLRGQHKLTVDGLADILAVLRLSIVEVWPDVDPTVVPPPQRRRSSVNDRVILRAIKTLARELQRR
jgi:hypothetical protein